MQEQNGKKTDKEKIKELAEKKKEMQQELDELKGKTAGGKAVCALVFFVLTVLLLGIFMGMVKLDTGGVASEVLAPVIADVPVLRNVLPVELQKKNASELAAEQKQQEAAAASEQAAAEEAAAEEAKALQDYVDTYSAIKPKDAAKVFDSMMTDQKDLVVRILENLTSDQRAAILSKMSVANAAILTEKMRQ